MPDREKVIHDIEEEIRIGGHYLGSYRLIDLEMLNEILTLFKEQEAVEPIIDQDTMVCGNCGHEVIWQKPNRNDVWEYEEDCFKYCPKCGRAVKWNE